MAAASFLFNIANSILGKLGSHGLQELYLIWGVKNELNKLKKTLLTIRDVLLDAEEQQAKNYELTTWLEELKDILYDADDFLDEIQTYGQQRQRFKSMVCISLFSPFKLLLFRYKMAHKIKEIRERLDNIAADKAKFHLSERTIVAERTREMTYSFILPSDVVGRRNESEEIVKVLMQQGADVCLSVVSIVGIGGVGKTTLAKLVYRDERIVKHFPLRIWLCASQDFYATKLARNIVNLVSGAPCDSFNIEQVHTSLQDALKGKRFLLIIDDVWCRDRSKWVELRSFLMVGASGSKVVVTTRTDYIASMMEAVVTYNLKELPHEDCFSLFLKWAFRNGHERHFPNLTKIGEDIVKKCKGVPLAVKTLGSMLYGSTDEREWLKVRDDEIWQLNQKDGDILPALKLSYNQLPYYLKQCFAYCSIFPKGQEIASIMLIQLWLAQGLIYTSNESQELEDVGVHYVRELCSRSLFEEVEAYDSFITFKMHDLVHDLAVLVAQTDCCVIKNNTDNITEKVRHVTLFSYSPSEDSFPETLCKQNRIRTIFAPAEGFERYAALLVGQCISRFKYLRVLDLRHSSLEMLPDAIGNMKHLRYIDFSGNNIQMLPANICKLPNLQTLRLVLCTKLQKLPRELGNLVSLRHLYLTTKEQNLPEKGLGSLALLQSLSIFGCENLVTLFEGMQKLTTLRTLVIGDCPRLTSFPRGIMQMSALESFMIVNCEELMLSDWQDTQGLKSIRALVIGGLPHLVALPEWLKGDSNSLKFIRISTCPSFVALPAWLGNATALEKLEITGCPKLTSLPDSISNLTTMKMLKIQKCPGLTRRCEKTTGEDWSKIANILEIHLNDIRIYNEVK